MSHPAFPFIGAGEAHHFEWAELFVCFTREPTKAEVRAINNRVPAPLRDTVEWKGPVLWVASEQGVGRLITATYKRVPTPPTKLTTQSKFKIAPASADARFNADVDAWLEAAHGRLPILVAFRGEDHEAGGTKPSTWHHESVKELPRVLAALAKLETGEAAGLGLKLISVARAAKVEIAPKLAARLAEVAEAQEGEVDDGSPDWDALAARATAALGPPTPRYTKLRTDLDVAPIAKLLPLTAKRLQRLAGKGLAVRGGASDAAIAGAEKALGTRLTSPHRSLLAAFDGGQIGDVTILGTAKGGATGDAELVRFTRAWNDDDLDYAIVARGDRDLVIAVRVGSPEKVLILSGQPGWGGGRIVRESRSLDTVLDLVLKAGKLPS